MSEFRLANDTNFHLCYKQILLPCLEIEDFKGKDPNIGLVHYTTVSPGILLPLN